MAKVNKVVKALQQIADAVMEKYEYINWGGCCVFASIAGKHLEDLGHEVRVRVISYYDEPYGTLRECQQQVGNYNVLDWNSYGVDFNHVMLEVKVGKRWRLFDAEGVSTLSQYLYDTGYTAYDDSLTVQEAAALAAKAKGWNDTFSRRNIPGLRKLIRKQFEQHFPVAG